MRIAILLAVAAIFGLTACGGSPGASNTLLPAATAVAVTTPPQRQRPTSIGGSGKNLAKAVSKVILANGATPSNATCDTFPGHKYNGIVVGKKGEIVDCHVTISDGGRTYRTGIRVTWDDNHGHFQTAEQAG